MTISLATSRPIGRAFSAVLAGITVDPKGAVRRVMKISMGIEARHAFFVDRSSFLGNQLFLVNVPRH
jgi:hypothetical protein